MRAFLAFGWAVLAALMVVCVVDDATGGRYVSAAFGVFVAVIDVLLARYNYVCWRRDGDKR